MNTKLPIDVNPALLILLILYLRDQEELYVDYHDGFISLADWLYVNDFVEVYRFPIGYGPRICSRCSHEYEEVIGGQVLEDGCVICKGQVPYEKHSVRLIWKFRFCEILKMNHAYFDYHLAHALKFIKNHGVNHEYPGQPR